MGKRKTLRNNKGFTLVEMIVVIVILGILLGIMVPQLIKYIYKAKAVQCRVDISYIMKEYQIEAMEKDPADAEEACTLLEAIVKEHNGSITKKGEIFNGGIYSDVCTSKGLYTCTFDNSYKTVTVTCSEHDEEQIEVKKLADALNNMSFNDMPNCHYKSLSDYFNNGKIAINSEAISTGEKDYAPYGSLAKAVEAKLKKQGINTDGRSWRMYNSNGQFNLFLTDSQKITADMVGQEIPCTKYDIVKNEVIHGTMTVIMETTGNGTYPILKGESFKKDEN